jgi:hypothetical protein
MKKNNPIQSRGNRWLHLMQAWLMLSGLSGETSVARMLEDVEVVQGNESAEVHIQFAEPLQYISHTPRENGGAINVTLRSSPALDSLTGEVPQHDSLSWKPTSTVPLAEVSYEAGASQSPQMVLRFTRMVRFQVQTQRDLHTLVVAVFPPPTLATDPRKIATGTADSPSDSPPSTLEVSAKANDSNAPDLSYTINLQSSLQPIQLRDVDPISGLEDYRLYTTNFLLNGKT